MQRLSILISLIPFYITHIKLNTVSKIIEQLMTWQKINDMPVSACIASIMHTGVQITLDKLYVKATLR